MVMRKPFNRRDFLRVTTTALGAGALLRFAPLASDARAAGILDRLHHSNGEAPRPFSIVQLSDTHVGFNGPPDPLGTKAFERAVDMINGLPQRPDLVLFTGDLTHDSEERNVHV